MIINSFQFTILQQAWGNVQIVGELKSFLLDQTRTFREYSQLWAAMGHLTPSFWDLVFRGELLLLVIITTSLL